MAWRIVGGLGGWLVSLAPLVIVNVLAMAAAIDPGIIPIAGGAALILGVALGGLLAGLLGGRSGGGWGGAVAGAIAAVLFAASLIALGYVLLAQGALPYLLALHLLRAMGAIGFVACLVMGVAAAVGAVSGRRHARRAVNQMRQASATQSAQFAHAPARRVAGAPSQPYPRRDQGGQGSRPMRDASRPPQPSQPALRGQGEPRRTAESQARERSPRW